jgi:hypothetical protein
MKPVFEGPPRKLSRPRSVRPFHFSPVEQLRYALAALPMDGEYVPDGITAEPGDVID